MKLSNTKKLIIFLGLGVSVVVLGIGLIDDSLSDTSKALLADKGDWQGTSTAYLYYLGLNAPLGMEPLLEGKAVLSDIRILEKDGEASDAEDFPELPVRKTLSLPEYKWHCSLTEKACLDGIFGDENIRLDEENLVALKTRYLHLLTLDDFHELTKPHINAPILHLKILFVANRALLLDAISLAAGGHPKQATANVTALFMNLKKLARGTESLVNKMVTFGLMDTTLDVLFMLFQKYKKEVGPLRVTPLSKAELSLRKPFIREFAIGVDFFRNENKGGDSWTVDFFTGRFFYKVNLLINEEAEKFSNAIRRSECGQADYFGLKKKHEKIKDEKSWVRNSVGTLIATMGRPDYDRYITSGFDLNAKIALIKGLAGSEITQEEVAKIPNPYFGSGHGAQISKDGSKVCFPSAGEERSTLCLSLEN